MERASKLIRALKLPCDTLTSEELACAAWPQAVGKKIAYKTRATGLVRDRLVVEVEDQIWQRQLFALSHQILRNLRKSLGPGLIDDIEFRVVPSRRGPQRAAGNRPSRPAHRRCRCHRRPRAAQSLQDRA